MKKNYNIKQTIKYFEHKNAFKICPICFDHIIDLLPI